MEFYCINAEVLENDRVALLALYVGHNMLSGNNEAGIASALGAYFSVNNSYSVASVRFKGTARDVSNSASTSPSRLAAYKYASMQLEYHSLDLVGSPLTGSISCANFTAP